MTDFIKKLICFILLGSCASFAQEKPPELKPLPKLIVEAGRRVALIFPDGREADLFLSHSDPFTLKANLDLTESLCASEYTIPRCYYKAKFVYDYLTFRWTQHLDPQKIGQTVKAKYDYTNSELTDLKSVVNFTYLSQFIGARPDQRLSTSDTLECTNLDWLGGVKESLVATDQLQIKTWSTESMNLNPETRQNENRTTQIITEVHATLTERPHQDSAFYKISINQFQKMQMAGSVFSAGAFIINGNVSTLQFQQKDNNSTCQVSFAHSLTQAVAGLNLDSHYYENPRFQPYHQTKSLIFKSMMQVIGGYLNPTQGASILYE